MGNEFEDRLKNIPPKLLGKNEAARSMISTAEDTHESLQELRGVNNSLAEMNLILNQISDVKSNKKVNKKQVIDKAQIAGVRFEVVEYDSSYVGDLRLATDIYHAQKMGMRLRSLIVELNQGRVTMESGMFQSSEGDVKLKQSFSVKHMVTGIIRKMNEESFFRPEFGGTGRVTLESNFKFIQLLTVKRATRLVLEKGIYLASAGDWRYKTAKNFHPGMVVFTEKSILQTELEGAGLVALELPVHPTELTKHTVSQGRPFRVSGEHVLYWTGNLRRVVNPARKLLGNMASGRGIVEEYTGEGYVYTAPTLGYYNQIAEELHGNNTGNTDTIGEGADMGKRSSSFWEKIGIRGHGSRYNDRNNE